MKNIAEFLDDFEHVLSSEGDMFFGSGDQEADYDMIVSVIKHNGGYWSGNSIRYHFDENLNFTHISEKVFGL